MEGHHLDPLLGQKAALKRSRSSRSFAFVEFNVLLFDDREALIDGAIVRQCRAAHTE
ncbi:MAG: hypothetical protein IPI55_02140 [Flavobacteriales bacterium]|nr:hypothetical protein [Flavobacteriales bacterium]